MYYGFRNYNYSASVVYNREERFLIVEENVFVFKTHTRGVVNFYSADAVTHNNYFGFRDHAIIKTQAGYF
jgi:hypothetical protein